MCTMQNLRMGALTLTATRVISCLYLLIVGCRLVANQHLVLAFGDSITAIGGLTIVTSLFGIVIGIVLNCGAVLHNKFLLLVYLFGESILVTTQICCGLALASHVEPPYDYDLQTLCLRARPPGAPPTAECIPYLTSERYARMSEVWRSYNYLSTRRLASGSTKYYTVASHLEGGPPPCCGYGPPGSCEADPRPPPSESARGVLTWADVSDDPVYDVRVACSDTATGWYAASYYCSQSLDPTAAEPVVDGCRYDFPVGQCGETAIVVDEQLGCAAEVDKSMSKRIAGDALGLTVLAFIYASGIAVAICLAAKRPALDALPDHVERGLPWVPQIAGGDGGGKASTDAVLARLLGKPLDTGGKDAYA